MFDSSQFVILNAKTSKEFRIELCKDMLKHIPELPENFVEILDEMMFFDAPASTKYHGSYPGGLFDHSILVAQILCELTKLHNLKWINSRSAVLIGLFHDLCKIDHYVFKHNEDYGIQDILWNNNQLIEGHAEKSIMLLSQFLTLNVEEIVCIRYHMGAFSDNEKERKKYGDAISFNENVLWTHTADMIASRIFQI